MCHSTISHYTCLAWIPTAVWRGFCFKLIQIIRPSTTSFCYNLRIYFLSSWSNAPAKTKAFQDGFLDDLWMVLTRSINSTNGPSDRSLQLRSSGLFALSALLRDFPSAQRHFFTLPSAIQPGSQMSGFDLLTQLAYTNGNASGDQLLKSLRLRVFTLLGDICLERVSDLGCFVEFYLNDVKQPQTNFFWCTTH